MAATPRQEDMAPPGEEFDPANQSLADALRKSFGVLKVLMLVLVVLYFLSGWFSVKQGERGVVLRLGRIVGAGEGGQVQQAVLGPGWHWSWPFPIDRWMTVPVNERELDLEFMFALSDKERATGVIERRSNSLSPERDDYLVTGDVNILHASLVIKYHVSNVVDYVSSVYPMPDPKATIRSKPFHHFEEYTLLRNLARDAVIEAAAKQAALDIRGNKQDEFLRMVARALNRRLKFLADQGTPLGIEVYRNNGVMAPKSKSGKLEAIMPPRQTQEVFDKVFTAQSQKSIKIKKARADADALLVNTAGPAHEQIAEAIEKEYKLLRAVSRIESKGASDDEQELGRLKQQLAEQRKGTESLLTNAAGKVGSIIKDAEIQRDKIVKEARGDYNRFMSVLPEYLHTPRIFLSRLRDEAYARALSDKGVIKLYVPPGAMQYRLHIPRSGEVPSKKEKDKDKSSSTFTTPQSEMGSL